MSGTTDAGRSRTKEVVAHWYPRFLVAGVPYADLEDTLARVDEGTGWLRAFLEAADRHDEQAEALLAEGRRTSAGEAWVRAAVTAHFGQFMAFDDADAKAAAARRKVELYARAAPLLRPPAEPVTVPFDGDALHGYLRRPEGGPSASGTVPLVVLVPGSDSTKEEFDSLERVMLARGLATLSVDGPGQGEGRALGPLRPGWGPALRAVLDAVADLPGIGRVGLLGMAFGGHLVLDGVHAVPEVAAVVSVNGFHDLGSFWDELPAVYRDNMRHALGTDGLEEAARVARGFSLAAAPTPDRPVLVVHGARDRIFPVREAQATADHVGTTAELVVYPEGNHVCNNVPYRYRPLAADWLVEHLTPVPEETP